VTEQQSRYGGRENSAMGGERAMIWGEREQRLCKLEKEKEVVWGEREECHGERLWRESEECHGERDKSAMGREKAVVCWGRELQHYCCGVERISSFPT